MKITLYGEAHTELEIKQMCMTRPDICAGHQQLSVLPVGIDTRRYQAGHVSIAYSFSRRGDCTVLRPCAVDGGQFLHIAMGRFSRRSAGIGGVLPVSQTHLMGLLLHVCATQIIWWLT